MTGDECSKALMENTEAGVTLQIVQQPLMSSEVLAYVSVLRQEIANQCDRADALAAELRYRDDREDIEQVLIRSTNHLCEFVDISLPVGWEVCFSMTRGEATMSLFNPDGDEVEVDTADYGTSQLSHVCSMARAMDKSP